MSSSYAGTAKISILAVKALLTLLSAAFFWQEAAPASSLFDEKCSGCHTIGSGASVGPDLAASAKWDDSKLSPAIKQMEKNCGPLTDSDIAELVQYIKRGTSSESSVPDINADRTEMSNITEAKSLPQGSAQTGEALFKGGQALANGGLSCIACHQMDGSGGNMGPDLTNIAAKMPEQALHNGCLKTPFKVMSSAYKDHPLQDQEALDITAYLISPKGAGAKNNTEDNRTRAGAAVFSGLVLAGVAFGYRNRSARSKLKRRS